MDEVVITQTENLDGSREYHLFISNRVLTETNLDGMDRRLIDECNRNDATISDKLLALEMVVRRYEQGKTELRQANVFTDKDNENPVG